MCSAFSEQRNSAGASSRQVNTPALFDFRNGRVPAGDLDSVAHHSTKHRASERRDIGYGTPRELRFIFTNNAECLRPATVPPYGHRGPKMYFAFIGCRFDDL